MNFGRSNIDVSFMKAPPALIVQCVRSFFTNYIVNDCIKKFSYDADSIKINRFRYKYIVGSFITCPFGKRKVPQRASDLPSLGLLTVFIVPGKFPPVERTSNTINRLPSFSYCSAGTKKYHDQGNT